MFHFNFPRYMNDADRNFSAVYKCYSISMLPNERQELENGGKIIMPPSALHTLTRLNTVYPMLFKLTNRENDRHTHCGVLEFVAEEGKVYLPYWMMRNLLLEEGSMIFVESASLPVATYSKFQPQNVDFLDISNPKAVLENALRKFACLTTDDMIAINYNDKIYELSVLETKPGPAVSIIECDMTVDFEAPVGYKEPTREKPKEDNEKSGNELADISIDDIQSKLLPFIGKGNRLDGKPIKDGTSDPLKSLPQEVLKAIPDYDYKIGTIKFWRNIRSASQGPLSEVDDNFKPFQGSGRTLFEKK